MCLANVHPDRPGFIQIAREISWFCLIGPFAVEESVFQ